MLQRYHRIQKFYIERSPTYKTQTKRCIVKCVGMWSLSFSTDICWATTVYQAHPRDKNVWLFFFLLKIPNPHERLPAVRNAVFLILTKIKVLQLCGSWHKSLSSSGQYQTLLTPKASMFVFNRNNQLFQDSSDYLGCQNITQRRSL